MRPRFRRSVSGIALSAAVLACAAVQPALAQTSERVGEADDSIIVTAQRANQTQVARGGNVGVLGNKAAEDVPFVVKSFNSALQQRWDGLVARAAADVQAVGDD